MRYGTKNTINLDGKLQDVLTYDASTLSAYKIAGFFAELFDRATEIEKEIVIKTSEMKILNIKKHDVYFIPENGWQNAGKQRNDYYGKFSLVVSNQNDAEFEVAAYDDCYNKEENINVKKIDQVKVSVSDAVVIEII